MLKIVMTITVKTDMKESVMKGRITMLSMLENVVK